MQIGLRNPSWAKRLGLGLVSAFVMCGAIGNAESQGLGSLDFIEPGMNQTELQSVLGPPDYIQVRGLRQAWQYCPRRLLQFADRLFRSNHAPYVTVWFDNFRVVDMQAFPSSHMGSCEDFIVAFRWEDTGRGFVVRDFTEFDEAGYGMK